MKNLLLLPLFLFLAYTVTAQECGTGDLHLSGKIYPSMHDGSLRGFNTGAEVGYSHFAMGVYGQNIFDHGESEGFYRLELQPRVYGCTCHEGLFAGFSYMHYGNSESSVGGLMGYKFQAVEFMYVEIFGGLQQNTSYEMDWNEIKWRTRFGVGLVFGL